MDLEGRVGSNGPDAPLASPRAPLRAEWLGRLPYREAWALQKQLVDARAAGEATDVLLLIEHDAVLTLGRNGDEAHVLASRRELARRSIEVVRVERGGEVTYHGPGQLVAYPILRLGERGLLIRPLVRALEEAMIETCAVLGVEAFRRDREPGCWVDAGRSRAPRKIGALGIRVERGVSFHGIALNIDSDLRDFELIDPCGTPGLVSTSIADELGRTAEPPTTAAVEAAAWIFAAAFARSIGAPLARTDAQAVSGAPAVTGEAPLVAVAG